MGQGWAGAEGGGVVLVSHKSITLHILWVLCIILSQQCVF